VAEGEGEGKGRLATAMQPQLQCWILLSGVLLLLGVAVEGVRGMVPPWQMIATVVTRTMTAALKSPRRADGVACEKSEATLTTIRMLALALPLPLLPPFEAGVTIRQWTAIQVGLPLPS